MKERIGQQAIHKLIDFLSNESGRVGAKSALAMGGLVGAAALTQMMFAPEAKAHLFGGCVDANDCNGNHQCCCRYVSTHNGIPHSHFTCVTRYYCLMQLVGVCN